MCYNNHIASSRWSFKGLVMGMTENKTYYGFENVDGELKIKKYSSKTCRKIKSKMHRQESIAELFAVFMKHFKNHDDPMSTKIIERHAIALDMGFYEFLRKAEILYNDIMENNPEKFI